MCHCSCGVHNKLPVTGQCFLVALSCVAVRCKCIYTNDMAAVLHMMLIVTIPWKPVYISVHCTEVKVIMKGLCPSGHQFLCHSLCPLPLKNSYTFPSKINA